MTLCKTGYGKLTVALVFAAAFAYQILCIFKGFDMTDEGFLMSLFQFFGEDPAAFPGGAGYPLSCYIGWWIHSLWPEGGILWVRFAGVLMVTATMFLSYRIVRKFTNSRFALLGLMLQVIFLATDPKPFGYNNASAFVYIAVVGLLVLAEMSDRILPLILSGLLGGAGIFLRLPDMAFIGLCILPFVSRGISREAFVRCAVFAICFVAGIAGGWLLMKAIGADSLILGFFSSLGGTLEGESTHSSSAMLMTYLGNYLGSLEQLLIVYGSILFISLLLAKKKVLWPLVILPLYVLYRNFYIDTGFLNNTTMMLYNGIGIVGCCLSFKKGCRLNVIPAAAILFSVLAPLGSDKGFATMWVGTWLALPVGLAAIVNEFTVSKPKYRIATLLCLGIISVSTLFSSFRHAYYDGGSRFKKTASIESIYAKGIKTKPENAEIVNGVLSELGRLGVKERDTILVFDSSPMFYFLTRTYSLDGLYWPCLQYGDQYVNTLIRAVADNPAPRVAVHQKFYNLGNGKGWEDPNISYTDTAHDGAMATKNMKKAFVEFLDAFHYTKVWSNDYYDIYVL